MQKLTKPLEVLIRLLLIVCGVEACLMFLLPRLTREEWIADLLDPVLLGICAAPFVWSQIVRPLRRVAASEMSRSRVSDERYHSLFQHMVSGFAYCRVLYDTQGRAQDFVHLAVNPAFGTLLGLHDVVGKSVSEVAPLLREHHPELLEIYGQVARTAEPRSFEIDLGLFGLTLFITVYCPEPEHFVAVFEDITDRKRVEAELRQAKEEWERTFDAIVDPVMILGPGHQVVRANKAMVALLGGSPGGVEQLICHHCVHGSSAAPVSCPHAQLMVDGQPHTEELYIASLGIHLMVVVSPLFDLEGRLKGSVHYARDITEQKKLERQLQHSQKMEAIGTLAGGVAHDFNNILTAMIGYGTLLEQQLPPGGNERKCLDGIMKAADRAGTLTRSLLSFSRKKETELKQIDLGAAVTDAGKLLKRLVRADIELVNRTGPELTVLGDVGQVEQVLMNLVANAQDAIPGPGVITLSTASVQLDAEFVARHGFGTPGPYALLTCADTGCGMDETTAQRIFDPFFTTKEIGKGTGLGLAIVYGIVSQHNGHIHCASRPGAGTTFSIYLPLAQKRAVPEQPANPAPWPGGSGTILLAEDDEQIRGLLAEILTRSGYRVIPAVNGTDAVSQFAAHQLAVDLVVSDVVMPELNGVEAFRRMKLLRPELKVLFMSGYSENLFPLQEWLGDSGSFLAKPLQPQDLLAGIRRMLGSDRTGAAAA